MVLFYQLNLRHCQGNRWCLASECLSFEVQIADQKTNREFFYGHQG